MTGSELFKLFGTIGLNNQEANKGIDETTNKAEGAGNKIAGFFKKAALVIGGAFAATKLVGFGKMTVEAAATAKAVQAQFEQVFGDSQTQAGEMITNMSKQFGMLPNRIKPAFTATASMFKGLGLESSEAMKYAEKATGLAADAAAFFDKSFEEADGSLKSFIKGNYEGGEAIGLFANETQMAAWAASELGLSWDDASEAEKQLARTEFAEAMMRNSGAAGQATRESEGYENQLGNMKQAWQDFAALVGTPILGVAIDGLQKVTSWLQTAGDKVVAFQGWFGTMKQEVSESTAFNSLKDIVGEVAQKFEEWRQKLIDSGAIGEFKDKVIALKDAIMEIDFKQVIQDVSDFIEKWAPLIAGIAAVAAALVILPPIIAAVSGALQAFAIIKTLIAAVGLMQTAFTFLAPVIGAINLPLLATVAAIGAAVAAGVWLWQNWDMVKAKAIEIWTAVSEFFSQLWTDITTGISSAWEGVKTFFSDLWTSISTGASEAWTSFTTWLTGIWTSITTAATEIWTGIVNVFTFIWMLIKEVFNVGWLAISTPLILAWQVIAMLATAIWTPIAAFFSSIWESIKLAFTTAWDAIMAFVLPIWDSFMASATAIFTAISDFFTGIWNTIKTTFETVVSAIVGFVSEKFNALKTGTEIIFNAISSVVSTVWNAIKTTISTVVSAISAVVSSVFNSIQSTISSILESIKTTVSNVWNGIKSTTSSVWEGIKTAVSNAVNSVKSTVTSVFEGVKSSVSGVWDGIKSKITGAIDGAKTAVSNAVNAIKGFMNFSWSLPKLKMPHFSVSGSFSLNPPSVPKLGIDWYKDGGIFSKATLFNTASGLKGVGEGKDSEAVLPLNRETLGGIGEGIAASMNVTGKAKEIVLNVVVNIGEFINKTEASAEEIAETIAFEIKRRLEGEGIYV